MSLKISTGARNAAAEAITDLLDGGTIKIYTGSAPANPQAAPTGTLLGTLTFANPAFGAASTGTVTANAITGDTSADATGTAGWCRLATSGGTATIDGDVTATGGGGLLELATVSVAAGVAINVTSCSFTMPES
jgi:hypothetical protein